MLARGLVEITDFAVDKGAIREGVPVSIRFLTQIASRFGIVVSQKAAAQAVAALGAVGGGALNLAFAEHWAERAPEDIGLINSGALAAGGVAPAGEPSNEARRNGRTTR